MLIRVVYTDGRNDMVQPFVLDRLIEKGHCYLSSGPRVGWLWELIRFGGQSISKFPMLVLIAVNFTENRIEAM